MSVEFAVRVNEQGELQIPAEIQRQLFPGMVVVLTLPGETNGLHSIKDETDRVLVQESDQPGLVLKEGLLVYRGSVAEGFDWDAFMQENRDAPLHPHESDLQ